MCENDAFIGIVFKSKCQLIVDLAGTYQGNDVHALHKLHFACNFTKMDRFNHNLHMLIDGHKINAILFEKSNNLIDYALFDIA